MQDHDHFVTEANGSVLLTSFFHFGREFRKVFLSCFSRNVLITIASLLTHKTRVTRQKGCHRAPVGSRFQILGRSECLAYFWVKNLLSGPTKACVYEEYV